VYFALISPAISATVLAMYCKFIVHFYSCQCVGCQVSKTFAACNAPNAKCKCTYERLSPNAWQWQANRRKYRDTPAYLYKKCTYVCTSSTDSHCSPDMYYTSHRQSA